jgi:hypothetical protein
LKTIVPLLGWVYIYLYKKYKPSDVLTFEGKRIIWIGNMCVILQAVFSGVMSVIWVITQDNCRSDACMQDFPEKIIPLGLLIHQICGGIVMPLFYTVHDVSASIISISITFTTLIAVALLLKLPSAEVFYIILTGIVISMTLVSFEGGSFINYTSFSQFETALLVKVASENQEYLLKIQTEEMRHMIGKYRGV